MADRLVDLILKNIDKDKLLQVQYERLQRCTKGT